MLTTKEMTAVRESSDKAAADQWFAQDGNSERLKSQWGTLSSYQAYAASIALRDAEARRARKTK